MIDVECMDRSQVPARVPITRNSAGDCNFLASSNCALPETSFAGVRCSKKNCMECWISMISIGYSCIRYSVTNRISSSDRERIAESYKISRNCGDFV